MSKGRIVLAGGSGVLGRNLERDLLAGGYEPRILTRSPRGARDVAWDGATPGDWISELDGARAVVNLAGRNVSCRHTAANRREILESRVASVEVLGSVMASLARSPAGSSPKGSSWSTATCVQRSAISSASPAAKRRAGVVSDGAILLSTWTVRGTLMPRGFMGTWVSRHWVLLVTTLAGVALGGCDGKPSTGTQSVAASEIIGAVSPCPAGFAHPNICCRDGACATSSVAPFDTCEASALLFPDRRRCCPLVGGDCIDAPPGDGGASAAASSRCTLPCGPEGRAVSAPDSVCGTAPGPDPTASCEYCCSGIGCYSNVCSCPMSVSVCNCGPACDPCPSGWSAPAAQVDLCCASPTRCFSQSAEVQAPEGGGTLSSPDGCEYAAAARGQLYDVKCDAKTSLCICTFDGVATKQFAFENGAGCSPESCGFPP